MFCVKNAKSVPKFALQKSLDFIYLFDKSIVERSEKNHCRYVVLFGNKVSGSETLASLMTKS